MTVAAGPVSPGIESRRPPLPWPRLESAANDGSPAMASTALRETTISRTRLMANGIGLVESLFVDGPRAARPRAESYSPDFQICLPYHGAFVWHVGQDDVVADANRVLFVAGDEGYRMSHPVDEGYAELIATIKPQVLSEVLDLPEQQLRDHDLFRRRSRPAETALQRLGAECLHQGEHGGWHGLAGEEWLLGFVRRAFDQVPAVAAASPSTRRLVGRAKAFLAANLSSPVRLSHVARAARTSPAYLTSVFRRVEGMPLHQYLVRLRLARALVELPHATDLTRLACDLGFSNHSHFSAAFRQSFGCTPSHFRERARTSRLTSP